MYLVIDIFLWIEIYQTAEGGWVKEQDGWNKYATFSSFIVLLIMYSFVILKLNRVMNRMDGNFVKEKRSVNCQFFVFLVSYFTRSVQ